MVPAVFPDTEQRDRQASDAEKIKGAAYRAPLRAVEEIPNGFRENRLGRGCVRRYSSRIDDKRSGHLVVPGLPLLVLHDPEEP